MTWFLEAEWIFHSLIQTWIKCINLRFDRITCGSSYFCKLHYETKIRRILLSPFWEFCRILYICTAFGLLLNGGQPDPWWTWINIFSTTNSESWRTQLQMRIWEGSVSSLRVKFDSERNNYRNCMAASGSRCTLFEPISEHIGCQRGTEAYFKMWKTFPKKFKILKVATEWNISELMQILLFSWKINHENRPLIVYLRN
jgi:hypothetical protein